MENNRSKENAARYAIVYNKILQMIQEGMYPEGSKLLSEPLLAEQMNVSRSTLRQALALLQEDGILEAKRGVGNFVRKTIDTNSTGIEKMDNPLYKSCLEEITHKRIELIPGISTPYTEQIFKRKLPVVLAVHRFYERENVVHAYCFSHISTDCEYLSSFDLNSAEELMEFLEQSIYRYSHSKKCEIKTVKLTDNLEDKHIENSSGLFQMIRESIVDIHGNVIALNKFYIPVEKAIIKVYSTHS